MVMVNEEFGSRGERELREDVVNSGYTELYAVLS